MEEITDFDNWFTNFKLPPVKFVAVFNPDTGAVISVGPSYSFKDQKHKISIDKELAESIINAEIKINNCIVDINSNTLEGFTSTANGLMERQDKLHELAGQLGPLMNQASSMLKQLPEGFLQNAFKNKK